MNIKQSKEEEVFELEDNFGFVKKESGSFTISRSPTPRASETKTHLSGNSLYPRKSSSPKKPSVSINILNNNNDSNHQNNNNNLKKKVLFSNDQEVIPQLSSSMPNFLFCRFEWERDEEYKQRVSNKRSMKPFLIGVAGGSASGKTSVCEKILSCLQTKSVAIISQDSFYKVLSPEEIKQANDANYNFDHPKSFDWELLKSVIFELREGKTVKIPHYDFKTHSRTKDEELIGCLDVVLVEGILLFYMPEILEMLDMKIFVDEDADTRLARRIRRDIKERGRDLENVLAQYLTFVKPSFEEFILPTKKNADIIIPRGRENIVAINLIVQHIKYQLNSRKKINQPQQSPYEF